MSKCHLLIEENESLGREIVCGNSQNLLRDINAQSHSVHTLTFEMDRHFELEGALQMENEELRSIILSLLPLVDEKTRETVGERMSTLLPSVNFGETNEKKRKKVSE